MKICVQSGGIIDHFDTETTYDVIAKSGFEGIDWNAIEHACKPAEWKDGCVYDKPLEECVEYFREEYAIIRKHGLVISQAHAPFPCYDPKDPGRFEYMLGVYKRMIEVCQYYQVPRVVVHAAVCSFETKLTTPESVREINRVLYESLIPTLQVCPDVTVCLENLFEWSNMTAHEGFCCDAREAVEWIDDLNAKAGRKAFGFCLDTGHLNMLRKDLRTFIPMLGDRLVCLHIHDNDGTRDTHVAPLTGTVAWGHMCQALKQINYQYDLSFETFIQARKAHFFDQSLLLPWLTVMAKTAEAFRRRILDKEE